MSHQQTEAQHTKQKTKKRTDGGGGVALGVHELHGGDGVRGELGHLEGNPLPRLHLVDALVWCDGV